MKPGGSSRRRNLMPATRAAALTALALALLVAGCGGSDATTTMLPSSTAAAADTTTSAPLEATTTSSTQPAAAPTTTGTTAATPTTVSAPHTPAIGTSERTAIMDAQRAFMAAQGMPSDVVFVVNWLRVAGGWAYSKVSPQSPDGAAQYEGLAFLLRDRGGWKVVDIFGSEGDMSEDTRAEDYMMTRNPEAPVDLFP